MLCGRKHYIGSTEIRLANGCVSPPLRLRSGQVILKRRNMGLGCQPARMGRPASGTAEGGCAYVSVATPSKIPTQAKSAWVGHLPELFRGRGRPRHCYGANAQVSPMKVTPAWPPKMTMCPIAASYAMPKPSRAAGDVV